MAGRPKIEINRDAFESLCGILCTLDEIAGFFHCSPDTIERWCKREYKRNFAEIYKKLSSEGKISLRRNQFKLAEKSAAMAIFLGKQYLGQSDVVTMQNGEESNGITIKIAKGECNETETEAESQKRKDSK